ncbi:transporter substrate-binding domain-containing protein [Enterococcus sp. RIT-PI-f]|uniref:transporter substrate-binding domain-containing protein n=1 Tax=Enterococcus sp. RIT-PI-f TaxID=1690244 RepID=UPI0006B95883|nr:transporter substrate-binding domain-containing protein [Enterococcus sp. RIT-PI-f]KPG71251.1 ABC transporter substrate-binding protein [Enterococcus sp. RIT-PI-f]
MKFLNRKKSWVVIGLAGLILGACGNPSATSQEDQSLSKVEEAKELVVATSGTLYPSSYYNDNNELVGYDVDVAKEVAERLGVEVVFKEYNVDGQVSSLTKGEADLAANDFGLTDERAEKFSLSTPFKYSFNSMIVRESDDSGIASLDDLAGKKAAGEPNTSYMRLAESYGAELVTYDNATNDQYLTDVANGRTDVIINDYYLQKMAVAAMPDIPVKILDNVYFDPNETGFLFVKDHKALREKVNEVLAEMKEDGSLKALAETYFQTDISVESDQEIQTVDTE